MNSYKTAALLDTNILVYAADEKSSMHSAAVKLRNDGLAGRMRLCMSPQILMEFYAVLTDSRRVENPREPREVLEEIEKYLASDNLMMIYPKEDTLPRTLDLLGKHKLRRQHVFDAQLVATMLSNGISEIYTYDQEGFSHFKEVKVLSP